MRSLSLLIISFLLAACNQQEIPSYNDLTPAEQAAIESARKDKCLRDYASVYANFKEDTALLFDSDKWVRGKGFYHEYKGKDFTRKVDIRIWKQDRNTDDIYFYITDTLSGSSSYFLKMSRSQNEAILDDVYADHCDRVYTVTGTTGLTAKYEYTVTNAPNTDTYTDTYTLSPAYPIFFANFNLARKKVTKNSSGTVTSTLNDTSTLTAKTFDFGSYTTATDAAQYTQKFCLIDEETAGVYRFMKAQSTNGFRLQTVCASTPPVDWDLSI